MLGKETDRVFRTACAHQHLHAGLLAGLQALAAVAAELHVELLGGARLRVGRRLGRVQQRQQLVLARALPLPGAHAEVDGQRLEQVDALPQRRQEVRGLGLEGGNLLLHVVGEELHLLRRPVAKVAMATEVSIVVVSRRKRKQQRTTVYQRARRTLVSSRRSSAMRRGGRRSRSSSAPAAGRAARRRAPR